MITPVSQVAYSMFLDPDITQQVAQKSKISFLCNGVFVVTTWGHKDFVEEVRTAQGDRTQDIRSEQFSKLVKNK